MYTNLPCKNVMLWVNIHMKNVNGGDFDTNINRDMYMKVMILFIDIKLRVVDKYIYLYHAYCLSLSCVLLSASFMCMMM